MVIPSFYAYRSGPEKDELIEEYRDALMEIDCRHFNKGHGECPFLNSCMYSHILPNGEYFEYERRDDYKYDEYGEQLEDSEVTLADRLGNNFKK